MWDSRLALFSSPLHTRAMVVLLLATLDTKGVEAAFVRDRLRELGVEVRLVDCGTLHPPSVAPDVPRETVLAAAGTTLAEVRARGDRAHAVQAAARGARKLASEAALGQRHVILVVRFGLLEQLEEVLVDPEVLVEVDLESLQCRAHRLVAQSRDAGR